MFQQIFDAAEFADQLLCGFLSDARTTGNVVGGVTHQSEHINDLPGGLDVELGFHLLYAHDLKAACVLGSVHKYVFGYQLAVVFIRGHHVGGDALLPRLRGKRADNIVGFIARYFQDRDAVCADDILYNRYGEPYGFRSFLPLCLILFICFMAEGGSGRVESDTDMAWIFFFEHFLKRVHKAKNGRGIEPFGIGPRGFDERVIGAIYQCIGIEKKQFIVRIHIFILFFMVKVQKNTVLTVLLLFLWENSDAWTTHHL